MKGQIGIDDDENLTIIALRISYFTPSHSPERVLTSLD
jgi:hypothetical protein